MKTISTKPAEGSPIPYGRQDINDDDIQAVALALRNDYLTQGPKVEEFETKFARYVGAKHAIAVANGTAALHLCALALNVDKRSRVITTPITFAASGNCVRYCGGEVWFSDIDPHTLTLDINAVKTLIESYPKGFFSGIIPVDFAGYPVDLEAFRNLADKHGLWIIEDACHAPGAARITEDGQKYRSGSGDFAELAIFSFHPVKHIACGEGGMVTTNDDALADRIRKLRTHGITKDVTELHVPSEGGWYMEMQELGYNYRMPDILCALGVTQLARADGGLARRREIARRYDSAFSTVKGVSTHATFGNDFDHAFHLYVIHIKNRKGLYDFLREHQIYAQVHYIPLHTMPYYKAIGYKNANLENSEAYYVGGLSIPMYPTLTGAQQDRVIELVKEFVR